MASGGARNRSGPQVDPNSARSDARGVVFSALPSEGYAGEVPDFPLPDVSVRESELWDRVWRSPQACAWAQEPWRHYTVGQYVRWSVKCEGEAASASLVAQMIRLADQIGLTPAGLKENGWAIAADELAARTAGAAVERKSSRSRIKAAG
jgi:hypothetical protein